MDIKQEIEKANIYHEDCGEDYINRPYLITALANIKEGYEKEKDALKEQELNDCFETEIFLSGQIEAYKNLIEALK